MTVHEAATALDGSEYREEGSKELWAEMKSVTEASEFQRGRLAGLEEAATIAQAHHAERTGHEWVRDSLWDNIIGRIPAVIRAHIGAIA